MRWTHHLVLAVLGAVGVSCGKPERIFAPWPELAEGTIAFVVEGRETTGTTIFGPFGPTGPVEPLESLGDADRFVLVFETEVLAALHPRVDPAQLSSVRLIPQPSSCSECTKTCREESNRVLYHPAASIASAFVLENDGFRRLEGPVETTLWIQLAARWECPPPRAGEVQPWIARWPEEAAVVRVAEVNGALLAIGTDLRRVDGSTGGPELVIEAPEGWTFDAVASLDAERILATSPGLPSGEPTGEILEIDTTDGGFELVESRPLPFRSIELTKVGSAYVLVGFRGEISTSTDGATFDPFVIQNAPVLVSARYIPGLQRPLFLGGRTGQIYRIDPFNPDLPVQTEFLPETVDSSIATFVVVRGPSPSGSGNTDWLWARSFERGLWARPLDGDADDWRAVGIEPPREPPECTQGLDSCGFAQMPNRSKGIASDGRRVVLVPQSCPNVLVAHPEHGCATAVELRTEQGVPGPGRGEATISDGRPLIVLPDGLLELPPLEEL